MSWATWQTVICWRNGTNRQKPESRWSIFLGFTGEHVLSNGRLFWADPKRIGLLPSIALNCSVFIHLSCSTPHPFWCFFSAVFGPTHIFWFLCYWWHHPSCMGKLLSCWWAWLSFGDPSGQDAGGIPISIIGGISGFPAFFASNILQFGVLGPVGPRALHFAMVEAGLDGPLLFQKSRRLMGFCDRPKLLGRFFDGW